MGSCEMSYALLLELIMESTDNLEAAQIFSEWRHIEQSGIKNEN